MAVGGSIHAAGTSRRAPVTSEFRMSDAVLDILHRIEALPEQDRLLLQEHLARAAEAEWQREAEEARRQARARGIDQAAIDRAVEAVRYSQ
jgi:hypothetical protein